MKRRAYLTLNSEHTPIEEENEREEEESKGVNEKSKKRNSECEEGRRKKVREGGVFD